MGIPAYDDDLAAATAAALERAHAEPATSWLPRDRASGHPKAIAGAVVETGIKTGRGYNGGDVATVTIRTPEGVEWLVWCFGTVLQQDLGGCRVGDVVAIAYAGHREGKSPSGYELYKVVVVRRAGQAAAPIPTDSPTEPHAYSDGINAEPATAAPRPVFCTGCGQPEDRPHVNDCPYDEVPF